MRIGVIESVVICCLLVLLLPHCAAVKPGISRIAAVYASGAITGSGI